MSQKGKQTKTGDQPKQQKPQQQSQQQQQQPPQQSQQQQQKPPQQQQKPQQQQQSQQQKPQQQQKPPQQQQKPQQQQQPQQQSQQQPQSAPSTSSSRSLVPVSLPINIKLLPPLPPGTTNVLSKPAVVQTNMFPVSLNETLLNDVYQYSVSFSEAIPSSHTKRKFFYSAALLATVPFLEFMAFDGDAMAYSFRKFSDQTVDIAARMNDLIAKKQLYDEFGQLVTAAGSNLPHVTIKLTNHYLLGDSLTQIKSHGLTSTDSSANADDVKYRSELGSIITMSLSTLMRHSSAVFALHAERNRIRVKINKDPAYWKSPPGLAIRIQLSIEYFISRNGAIFRLDQFFNQTPQQIEQYAMGKGIYAVPAGFSALRFLQRGVLFNVASIVLPTYRIGQKVIEILEEIAPNGNLATAPQTVYKTILKYRAITNHLPDGKNSRVGLHTVGPKVKDCPTFLKDGKQVSIAKHFLDTYKIKLNPEYYTYAIVKSFQERTDKSGKLIKAHEETFYYPVEVLTLYSANNNCAKDLDPFQTKAMLTLMTKRPHHSLIAANDQLKSLQTAITYHQQQTPGSAADGTKSIYHGIQITATPISTTARVLPPPSAEFSNQTVPASAGEFKPRPDWKFVQSASNITSKIQVVVANLSNKLQRSPQMIDTYVENVIKIAQTKGLHMQLDTTQAVFTQGRFDGNAAKQLEQWARQLHSKGNQQKITYLVLAICDSNSEFYDALKRVGDGELGLVTQCADSAKIQKTFGSFKGQPPNPSSIASYVGNIILKINSKLGGLNYRLKPTKDIDNPVLSRPASKIHPTISNSAPLAVFGIDIFHNPGKRSHAGIVGSWDKSCSHYNGVLVQQPRAKNGKAEVAKEVINPATIQKAFVELLFQYAQKQPTLSLPQQMVVYRDGLSESQIALSMENEIPGIIAAAQQAYLTLFPTSTHKYEPTITFLIAVKRHHTFFVPQAGEDDPCGRARTENVRAGTVVDKEVVRSDLTEFYLQGHASALGTGKCTLYQVVYSSAPKTANLNDIQLLTNYLSYGHQRAFKSTRIPTPVYFADLLCYRGRSYASPSSQDGSWAFQDLPSALTARHFWL